MKPMKLQGVDDNGTRPRFHQKGPRVKNALKAFAAASALALFSLPAQASIFTAAMLGANEVPPKVTTATGFTTVVLDDVADTLKVDVTWSGLIGGVPSAAHIHCCVAPGASAPVVVPFTGGFPAATSGTYSHLFDLTDPTIFTPAFLTLGGGTAEGAETLLIAGLFAGTAYSNIHNATFPGGEIRGLLTAPEPATLALFGSGLLGLGFARRKTKRA